MYRMRRFRGGLYAGAADSGVPGAPTSFQGTRHASAEPHRIEKAAAVSELTRAGFALQAKSDYLHVSADPREQPFFKMEGKPDDKFALRFVQK